jgi:hypothetical protein
MYFVRNGARAHHSRVLHCPRVAALLLLVAALGAHEGCMRPDEAKKWQVAESTGDEPAKPVLQYAFKPDERYVYTLEVEANFGEISEILKGRIDYTVQSVDDLGIVLDQSGSLYMESLAHPSPGFVDRGPSHIPGFLPIVPGRRVTIDRHGKVLQERGGSELPYFIGNLTTATIELLAEEKSEWTEKVALTPGTKIPLGFSASALGRQLYPPPSPFASPPPGVVPPQNWMLITSGTKHCEYRRATPVDGTVKIDKRVEIHCEAALASTPVKIDVTGDGTLLFDVKESVFSKGRLSQEVTVRFPNTTTSFPVLMTFNRMSREELAALDKRMADAETAIRAEREKRNKPLGLEETEMLLDQLRDPSKRLSALARLQTGKPNQLRAQVALALDELVREDAKKRSPTAHSVFQALALWATKDNIPTLVPLVDSEDLILRMGAVKVLGTLPDERSAAALAKRLPATLGREAVSRALQALGPVAEEPVLDLLPSQDKRLRDEICRILAVIGTKKSLPKLQAVVESQPRYSAYLAEEAIRKIEARP